MSVKEDIRAQIIGALAHAKFPIDTPEALFGSFPDVHKPHANLVMLY